MPRPYQKDVTENKRRNRIPKQLKHRNQTAFNNFSTNTNKILEKPVLS